MKRQRKIEKESHEQKVIETSLAAITERYGSLKDGFMALLDSKQPQLIKFVFEHAVGRPKEKLDIDSVKRVEHIQVIQLPHNNRDVVGELIEPVSETINVQESAKILASNYGETSSEEATENED
jgi:hypothetical protein